MTNPNYTHLLVITDRSGSMISCATEMINALNTYFDEQAQLDGKCLVDYVQFDNTYERVFSDTPVADARAVLDPRGSTALLDAMGRGVVEFGTKLAGLDEDKRPGTVIVVVITDGYENASQEWTAKKVRELVTKQRDEFNWTFTFLGANLDAVAVGAQYGFAAGDSLTFNVDNTAMASASLSGYTTRTRTGLGGGYTDEDRAAQKA